MGFLRFKGHTVAAACALFLVLPGLVADAQCTNRQVTGLSCLEGGCTANDVKVGELTNVTPVGNDICSAPTDTIKFTADFQVVTDSQTRYDIGLFIGDRSDESNTCSVYTFTCVGDMECLGDCGNENNNDCGDIGSSVVYKGLEIEIPCILNGEGRLDLPYCMSWSVQSNSQCTGPSDVGPAPDSKCRCSGEGEGLSVSVPLCTVFFTDAFDVVLPDVCPEEGGNVDVTIPAAAIVGSVDNPAQDFTATVSGAEAQTATFSAGDNIDLSLPNGAYTIVINNPNFASCESQEKMFTIDCVASTPAPVPDATPAPVPDATPAPVPDATPAPVPEPTPAPVPDATPAPVPDATPAPVPDATPAPVPDATPAPTGLEVCSNGVTGIENGNSKGVVCCDVRCGKCGGTLCSLFGGGSEVGLGREFCCINPILDTEVFCLTDKQDAPCIISKPTPSPVTEPTPAPVPEPTPAPVPGTTPAPVPDATPAPVPDATPAPVPDATPAPIEATGCSDGTVGTENSHGGICCDKRCGSQCGGTGCFHFGGGKDAGLGPDFCCLKQIREFEVYCDGGNNQAAPCIIGSPPSPSTPAPVPQASTPAPVPDATPAPVPDVTPAPIEATGCSDGTVGTENSHGGICCDKRCGSQCGGTGCFFFGGGKDAGLGPDFCCLKQIRESEVYCDGGNNQAAPCIIGSPPSPSTPAPVPQASTPAPVPDATPAPVPDVTPAPIEATGCSDGTVGTENSSGGICCDKRCGSQCGGTGCFHFGGGKDAGLGPDFCCLKQILESEVYCDGGDKQAAPCIIGTPPSPSTPAPVPQGATCSSLGVDGLQGHNDRGSVCCPLECQRCGGSNCGTNGSADKLDNTDCCINGVIDNQDPCTVNGHAPCTLFVVV